MHVTTAQHSKVPVHSLAAKALGVGADMYFTGAVCISRLTHPIPLNLILADYD
jgi:hypothetical protein